MNIFLAPITFTAVLLLLSMSGRTAARSVTVENKCSFTIWPALFTNPNIQDPGQPTGWEAQGGSSKTLQLQDGWSGRIWARTECNFGNGNTQPNACVTGGCLGGTECDKTAGTGQPATLAEFTFNGFGGLDFYDVSIVDGFNIATGVNSNKGCKAPVCHTNLNENCPDDSMKIKNPSGIVVACLSSCKAGIPVVEENCCSGAHNTPDTCPTDNVKFYSYFKDGCPDAYAYAYDEASGSAQWNCPSDQKPDYTVTFCA